ncbi:MAG: YqgE/AlgH family protein [Gammaproteobacteria bacterium]|jgi:putative transcriptional regulator
MADPYLTDHFLIAMPTMGDPNFDRTVTFICEHNEDGALGLVINRPMDLALGEIFSQMSLECDDQAISVLPVLQGGPVQVERGFVIHGSEREWNSTLAVSEAVSVTTSRDVLEAMAAGDGPERALVAIGYAGWGAGQLEAEMAANAWLTVPANTEILFDIPFEKRWRAAAALIGIDLDLLSTEAGHA